MFVPVLGRPHRAELFCDSLAGSDAGDVRVWAIPNADDTVTLRAWQAAAAIRPWVRVLAYAQEPGSFAQKCNAAFEVAGRNYPAPWVMLVGDDVAFHPGWHQAALSAAVRAGADVVGTNTAGTIPDGSTPHPLIRRSYILERGASWDGPGSLCHEGYRHNFVDVEITMLAIDRGVWTAAPDSIVEHLHHIHGGKSPVDESYRIGAGALAADRALFDNRAADRAAHT